MNKESEAYMYSESNNLSIVNELLAICDLPLRERDFIEAEKAILGKTTAVIYTIIVACCVAIIGAYGMSAQLGLDFLPIRILFIPLLCLPTASVYFFIFPKWLGILRYRQHETTKNQQRDVAFFTDHFEIKANGVNTGSYLYAFIKRIIISENLYIIMLPNMVVLPVRHMAIPEEKWYIIQQHINAAMATTKEMPHAQNADTADEHNRFARLMCFVLVIMLCSLFLIPYGDKETIKVLLFYDGTTQQKSLTDETEPTITQSEIESLDIEVLVNRENELVFSISINDYIDCYNGFFCSDYNRSYLTPSSDWQRYNRESAIHSNHETLFYYFTEDANIYSLPTIMVYVPANGNYIQEITINFDEHSYSESSYEQYKQMCFYTLKVFFPDLSDDAILDLCTEVITLGNINVFSSDEWYDSDSIPCALFYKDGIGVYPYFAIGDWEHFCIIPVTQEIIDDFEQKGVQIYEIE